MATIFGSGYTSIPALGFVHLSDDGDLELPFFENPGP